MKDQECRAIIAEINEKHSLNLDPWACFEPEFVTAEEYRRMALRLGGIEVEEEEPMAEEEGENPLEGITDPDELHRLAAEQRREREKKEKADFMARRERKLRRLRAEKAKAARQ